MTISELSKAIETRRPALGVAHGVRIGKSARAHRSSRVSRTPARDMLALRFMHVPDEVDLTSGGLLTQEQNRISVELPTKSETQTQLFSGSRRTPNGSTAVSDYILVFAEGAFWLERVSDFVNCLRYDGSQEGAMEMEGTNSVGTGPNDMMADPDSWMIDPSAEESASPITPEEDDVDDACATGATNTAPQTTKATVRSSSPTGRSTNHGDGKAPQRIGFGQKVASSLSQQASVAFKTLPGMSSTTGASAGITSSNAQNENGVAFQTVEVVMETVEENGGDGSDDNRTSKSSSSDSDSDDSSSESDSDSADYTDRSSSDEDSE